MDSNTMYLTIIIICLLLSSFFSASDTAFAVINKIRLKTMAEEGNIKARKILEMLKDYDSVVSCILVGNNIVNILGTSMATVLCINVFGQESGPTMSTVLTTVLVLLFGEITPKMLANENPEKFAFVAYTPINVLIKILKPISYFTYLWKKLITIIFKKTEVITTTEAELITFVEETAKVGTISDEESVMIKSVLRLSDLSADDILTPMSDVTYVTKDVTIEKLKDVFKETKYSRLPVLDTDNSTVLGCVYYKDLANDVTCIEDILTSLLIVYSHKNVKELMSELISNRTHICLVIDDYGNNIGIVTLEDILEEVVGDIWDESDTVTEEIIKTDEGTYTVMGSTSIDKVSKELGVRLMHNDCSVIGGLLVRMLGRVPKEGDTAIYGNITMKVVSMCNYKIKELEIKII